MPPPVPAPRITPNTLLAPVAAPSEASDRAKQSASLAMRTGLPSLSCRSCSRGLPFRRTELALRSRPVAGESAPGVQMPTGIRACAGARYISPYISPYIARHPRVRGCQFADQSGNGVQGGVVVALWCGDADARRQAAVRMQQGALDLGPAEIDAQADAVHALDGADASPMTGSSCVTASTRVPEGLVKLSFRSCTYRSVSSSTSPSRRRL